jgi:hypothetical protein
MNSTTTLGTDVCRIRESSSFFCPLGCMHTDEAPYCAQGDSTMSRVPCRAQPPLSSTDTAGRAAKAGEKGDWTNVSVKGVPMSVSSSFMRELFSTTGKVRSVNVHRKSSGAFYSANVAYSSRAAALEAAKRFNGESILDSPPLVVRIIDGPQTGGGGGAGHEPSPPIEKVMHTFYQPKAVSDIWTQRDAEILKLWKRHWERAGWIPVILTLADAQMHPKYATLRSRMEKLPLGGNVEYDLNCYIRWLAMAAVGGGWMSDYDTVPLNFAPPPELPNGGAFTGFEGHVPSLVVGSGEEWKRMIMAMIEAAEEKVGKVDLFSDMHSLAALRDRGNVFEVAAPQGVVDAAKMIGKDAMDCEMLGRRYAAHFSHHAVDAAERKIEDRRDVIDETITAFCQKCRGGNCDRGSPKIHASDMHLKEQGRTSLRRNATAEGALEPSSCRPGEQVPINDRLKYAFVHIAKVSIWPAGFIFIHPRYFTH